MHSSTAAASSGLIPRMLSSAFGDLREKFSQASYNVAAAEIDPGLNIDKEEAALIFISVYFPQYV